MSLIAIILIALCLVFGFVLVYGAPYLPTLKPERKHALDLLDLSKGQTMLELGSGDGGMLIEAAKRGIKSIGYEINPILFIISWIRCRKYGDLISIKLANFWKANISECDGVYVFLLDKYMEKLDKKITQENHKSIRLVSFTFRIPGKKSRSNIGGLYLYIYNSN